MSDSITIVTALYDIDRENMGDGRKFEQYLSWFKDTLKIQRPMVVFVDESLVSFVEESSNGLPTKIISQKLEEIPYYFLNDKINDIISSHEYKNKMQHSHRLECGLSLYNVVIYSKFLWMKKAIEENFFKSDYFMWIDAGLSRFFLNYDVDINQLYPSENATKILLENKNNVLVHASMSYFPEITQAKKLEESYFWDYRTFVMAGLWGGGSTILTKLCEMVDDVLQNKMIKNNVINNEMSALGYLLKNNDEMFTVFENYSHIHREYEIISELAK